MLRKILFLVLGVAALPLYASEEMRFVTVLGDFPEYEVGSFAVFESINPDKPLVIPPNAQGTAQGTANFCTTLASQGEIKLLGKGTPYIKKLEMPKAGGDLQKTLGSSSSGEYRLEAVEESEAKISIYPKGELEGKQLIARNIYFRPLEPQVGNSRKNSLVVEVQLHLPDSSGLTVNGAAAKALNINQGDSWISTQSGGTVNWKACPKLGKCYLVGAAD